MPSYKDAAGKWYCKFYYTNYEGQRRQKFKRGFTLKRDADAWERDFLQNIAFSPDMTFGAFCERYKKDTEPRLKQHTIQYRHYIYKNRIAPHFNDKPLIGITGQNVIQWQNELIQAGFSAAYLNNCHSALSAIFNHAARFYGLKDNPCKQAGSIGSKKTKQEMLFWTLDEFAAIIQHVDDVKAATAITLLYWSGIRKGEMLALTWADIDFDAATLRITKSYQRLNGKAVITAPKTSKSTRTLRLPKQAIDALSAYKALTYAPEPSAPVFDWEKRFVENAIAAACKASGVKRIRVHDLRHP